MEPEIRDQISHALGDTINNVVREHYGQLTQEPQLTARIGERLEATLDDTIYSGYKVNIFTQDIPSLGRGSMENKSGADLFISVSFSDETKSKSKGIFIQSKFDGNIKKSEITRQCSDMQKKSSSAYLMVYTPEGAFIYPASEIHKMRKNSLNGLERRTAEGFFNRVFACDAGDQSWGIPDVSDRRSEARRKLREAFTPQVIDVVVSRTKRRGRK